MALAIATVVDNISKLSVSGLTIKDMDEIPGKVDPRQPTLIPLPDFLSETTMERDSYGGGSTAKMTVQYTLNYRLCYAPVGAGRPLEWFDDMVSMVGAILDAVMAIDTLGGSIDVVPAGIRNVGIVNDPGDNGFYGADLAFRVTEFVN